jgi:hypothetical protein
MAVVPVWMLFARRLDLPPHVLATVRFHRRFTPSPNDCVHLPGRLQET